MLVWDKIGVILGDVIVLYLDVVFYTEVWHCIIRVLSCPLNQWFPNRNIYLRSRLKIFLDPSYLDSVGPESAIGILHF